MNRIRLYASSLRRTLSRSHLLTQLLRLSVDKGDPERTGPLLIQIDGLSRPQFERALDNAEIPFLDQLIRRRGYRLHSQHAGLPAVQAELFYGSKTAVPAFSFRDRETGEIVRMYDPGAATRVENRVRALDAEGYRRRDRASVACRPPCTLARLRSVDLLRPRAARRAALRKSAGLQHRVRGQRRPDSARCQRA